MMTDADKIYERANIYLEIIHLIIITCLPDINDTAEVLKFKENLTDILLLELRKVPEWKF